jgi:hypothetical protein
MNDKATNGSKSKTTKLPDVNLVAPGPFDGSIGQMTSDAIRASGLKVAADLMEVAQQARSTASAIEDEATAIAIAIGEATGGLADRIANYVASCKAAADSFRSHREALANLPPLPDVIDDNRGKLATAEIEALRAVEKIIDQPTKTAQ